MQNTKESNMAHKHVMAKQGYFLFPCSITLVLVCYINKTDSDTLNATPVQDNRTLLSSLINRSKVCADWTPQAEREQASLTLSAFIFINSSALGPHFPDVYPEVGCCPPAGSAFRPSLVLLFPLPLPPPRVWSSVCCHRQNALPGLQTLTVWSLWRKGGEREPS